MQKRFIGVSSKADEELREQTKLQSEVPQDRPI
jgi:hypothetical protein